MYFYDHNPPHVHVDTANGRALLAIESREVLAGSVERRALSEAKDWAEHHQEDLMRLWEEFNP